MRNILLSKVASNIKYTMYSIHVANEQNNKYIEQHCTDLAMGHGDSC